MSPGAAAVVLKLIDGAFLLFEAGLQREQVVAAVEQKIKDGATSDQIADMLKDGRLKSEIEAQAAIDEAPDAPKA